MKTEFRAHAKIISRFGGERTVDLGELTPGVYALAISGDGSLAADPCTLIDMVSVTGSTGFQRLSELSAQKWHLRVEREGRIALNYGDSVTIGSLIIDGQPHNGVYVTSTTHPDAVTGCGVLRIDQSGLIMIVR